MNRKDERWLAYFKKRDVAREPTHACPDCDSDPDDILVSIEDEEVQYGPNGPKTTIAVPIFICDKCKFRWTDSEAEELRSHALAVMLKRPAIDSVIVIFLHWGIRMHEKEFDGDVLMERLELIGPNGETLRTKYFLETAINNILGKYNRTFDVMIELIEQQLAEVYEEIKGPGIKSREEIMAGWHKKWYEIQQ